MSIKCPRCGFDNIDSATHCVACGEDLKKGATQINLFNFITQFLGFAELHGKVINIHPTYSQPPGFNWKKVLLFFVIILFVIYLIKVFLFFIILLIIFLIIMSLLRVPISSILFGMFMLRSRSQRTSRQEIPVQDVIIQNSDGNHLVRIKGYLKIGSISMGDSITVKGRVVGGMFIFRSGYNHSINSTLKLQREIF